MMNRLKWFVYGCATYAFFLENQIEDWLTGLILTLVLIIGVYALYRKVKEEDK